MTKRDNNSSTGVTAGASRGPRPPVGRAGRSGLEEAAADAVRNDTATTCGPVTIRSAESPISSVAVGNDAATKVWPRAAVVCNDDATVGGLVPGVVVGNDAVTMCGQCGVSFRAVGRQVWCSDACRQAVWRRRRAAPRAVLAARPDTVYGCPSCEARFLGVQRCEDCNLFARKLGAGGPCPHCGDLVAVTDLVSGDQFLSDMVRGRER